MRTVMRRSLLFLALALGCDTTPDDPLGHYAYAPPLRDLLPMFAGWERDEAPRPVVTTSARHEQTFASSSARTK